MRRILIVGTLLCSVVAAQAAPSLEPHDVGQVTISTPKGWAFTGDASKGMALARQDPSRKDGAQLLVLVSTSSNTTEDQLLDTLASQAAQGLKVTKRGAGPGGAGKLLVADGVTDGLRVRLGAVAIGASGTMVVGLLVAKPGDFDALGGTDLVISVMASLKASGNAAAPAPTPAGSDPVMEPQYDHYGTLIIPPPQRGIGLADLVGKWSRDDSAASRGSATSVAEVWTIDAGGGFNETYRATVLYTRGPGSQTDGKNTGKVFFDRGMLVIARDKKQVERFVVKGWFVGKDQIIMRLNGPYYDPLDAKDLTDPNLNNYKNHLYIRNRSR